MSNRGEFTSNEVWKYCEEHRIKRKFLATRTPQQNGVVERKNRTVEEMARTMLNDSKISDIFWVQTIHTTVLNRGLISTKVTRIHMGYGKEYQQMSRTLEFLEASST